MGEVISVVLPALSVGFLMVLWKKKLKKDMKNLFFRHIEEEQKVNSIFIDPR